MKDSRFISIEKNQDGPILIVDKQGFIGERLISLFKESSEKLQIVYVSQKVLSPLQKQNLILTIPYKKKIPVIPDGEYENIIFIYSGQEETFPVLKACVKKAESLRLRFFLIADIRSQDLEKVKDIARDYKESLILYIGDLFTDNPLDFNTSLNTFLIKVKKTGRIRIADTGLEKIYPVFLDDALQNITRVVFDKEVLGKSFFVFPKEECTHLSLAHYFQKIDPMLRVDFVTDKRVNKDYFFPKDGKYLFLENSNFLEMIKNTYQGIEVGDKRKLNFKDTEIKDSEKNKKTKKWGILYILSLFLFTLFIPMLFALSLSLLAFGQLSIAKKSIDKGEIDNIKNKTDSAYFLFNTAKLTREIIFFEAGIIGMKDQALKFFNIIDYGSDMSVLASTTLSVKEDLLKGENIQKSSDALKRSIILLQSANKKKQDYGSLSLFETSLISSIADLLPDVLGSKKQKTYLVLFQNNMELRPGGGFIGSYGILVLSRGKITDFSIHDVYDADGQLKGHIEPPFPIRRYLPQIHWYMRDSNWDIDFTKAASQSAYFLNLETGKTVDGVIAFDLFFVKSLLSAIGPIIVSDYNQTITENNFYEITQKYAQDNFFPGSRQKKNFLSALFTSIRENIISRKDIKYSLIAKKVQDAILEKHLLFAFSDVSLQNVFTVNNMSSAIWDKRINNQVNINDFFAINEANLGVNKVNYFVKRSIDHKIIISQKDVSEKVSITFENGRVGNISNADYKNYLRIILPKDAILDAISINGEKQQIRDAITDFQIYEAKNFVLPKEMEVEKTQVIDKTIFGFLVNIPKNTKKTIVVEYKLENVISKAVQQIPYNLMFFKQPGIDSYDYSMLIVYPSEFLPVSIVPKTEAENNNIKYRMNISKDTDFFVLLVKK